MPNYFAQLPAPEIRNALLNMQPVNNALEGVRDQNNANRNALLQQSQMDLQTKQFEQNSKTVAMQQEKMMAERSAGLAQMALQEKDPTRQAAIMQRVYSLSPDYTKNLVAHGIDPNDHSTVANFLIAEARGYRDPQDAQLKALQIQNAQSGISTNDLQRQKLQMEIDQAKNMNSMFADSPAPQGQPQQAVPVPAEGAGRFAAPNLTQQPSAPQARPSGLSAAIQALPPERQAAFKLAWQSGQRDEAIKILKESGTATSIGDKTVDKAFAKTYEEDMVSGALFDSLNSLKTLRGIAGELGSKNAPSVSGPYWGMVPDAVMPMVNQKSVDMQNNVAQVIQRSLRPVLGAQFTEKEGENLIKRAYNPSLDEATNAKRLNRLADVVEGMAKAKLAAAKYFEQNGTLKGYSGSTQFSLADIENAVDAIDKPAAGNVSKKVHDLGDGFTVEEH